MRLFNSARAVSAVCKRFEELTGDYRKINPQLRRAAAAFAVEASKEMGEDVRLLARANVNVIVNLFRNHDCNQTPEEAWPMAAELYKCFAPVLKEFGYKPRLIWPTYDAENAPDWASVRRWELLDDE